MSSSAEEMQQETPQEQVDIGTRLRQAREGKKLSVEVVAAQLKLRAVTLTYLEENRYEELPGETFVRGYIRSYANLLELDGNDLARMYEPEQVPGKSNYAPLRNIERKNRTRFILVLLVALVLVIAGLGYYWWQEQQVQQERVVQSEQQTQAPSPEIQVEGVDGILHIQSLDELSATTAEMELEEVPLHTAVMPEQEVQAQADQEAEQNQPGELQLSFIEDCWIRITDADGNELASGLKRAGEELVVTGEAPYEIHLGYAPGVFISFNGQQVDFDSSIRGNIARIKLG